MVKRIHPAMIDHIQAQTTHARRGMIANAFRYGVDYVLVDLDQTTDLRLLSRNRFNLWSLWTRHHGGQTDMGTGAEWFRSILTERSFPLDGTTLLLLTQPTFLWWEFNPVSFWLALRDGQICVVVAEVNNTFGHRHCYFCAHPDFLPIAPDDTMIADKLMYVSPFQKVAGDYRFNFDLTDDRIAIRIAYKNGTEGVIATLAGERHPATNASLAWAALRRPLGSLRVLGLIHWQALRLFLKRAPFMRKPPPPEPLISDSATFDGDTR